MKTKTLLNLLIASQIALTSQLAFARADIGGPQAETLDQVKEKIMRGEYKPINLNGLAPDKKIQANAKLREIGDLVQKLNQINIAAEGRLQAVFTTTVVGIPVMITSLGIAAYLDRVENKLENPRSKKILNRAGWTAILVFWGTTIILVNNHSETKSQIGFIKYSDEELQRAAEKYQKELEARTNELIAILGINPANP